ncbi:MAG: phospho-N-acetylmuramoyl-pentapeptide-transferase, partial [Clostridiales bacterium]|nr:phospho-N-acetylmuramoyl-pentapeptide-transferase [Clostridiales bacterium]
MRFEILIFGLSLIISTVVGGPIIHFLRKLKFGQKILEIGPKWHLSKQYTPTMGGIIFILSITLTILFADFYLNKSLDFRNIAVLVFALSFAAIGFVDDFTKIKKKQNLGLTAIQKLLLQVSVAAVFVAFLRLYGYLTPNLYIPFYGITVPMPWGLYAPFAVFVIIGAVNAVNLTDGIDGLASSVTLIVALFFAAVSHFLKIPSLTAFALALAGALFGFLFYNFNPAKVFMGDTGSLFLGGAVCGLAFACDMPLILVPIGIIYVAETVSDILQVGYFKLSHGKRLFKMAPLHHHFEMCGWSEKKIVFVFAIITAACCIVTYLGLS